MRSLVFIVTAILACSSASAESIAVGMPLNDAFIALSKHAVAVPECTNPSPLFRRDVFSFRDGRVIVITSRSPNLGDVYTIKMIRQFQAYPRLQVGHSLVTYGMGRNFHEARIYISEQALSGIHPVSSIETHLPACFLSI